MQNEQRMLQPCMMETKADASCGFGDVVADGVLRAFLLGGVADGGAAQRKLRIVHAGFEPALEDAVHVFENLVVFLGADDHIEARHGFEKLLAARLGHAAHEAVNDVFAVAARGASWCPFFRAPSAPPGRGRSRC